MIYLAGRAIMLKEIVTFLIGKDRWRISPDQVELRRFRFNSSVIWMQYKAYI